MSDISQDSESIKLVKKDCGKHSGFTKGPCSKCAAEQRKSPEYRQGFQYSGTPWIAVIGGTTTLGNGVKIELRG